MALVPCRECNASVSSSAEKCPQCGIAKPAVKASAKKPGALEIVFGLIGGLGTILWLANGEIHKNDPPPPKPPLTPAQQEQQERLDEGIEAAETLRAATRDPASFQLTYVIATDETRALCFEFRGRNAFNGVAVDHAVFDRASGKLTPERSAGFAPIWKAKCYKKDGDDIASTIRYGLR